MYPMVFLGGAHSANREKQFARILFLHKITSLTAKMVVADALLGQELPRH